MAGGNAGAAGMPAGPAAIRSGARPAGTWRVLPPTARVRARRIFGRTCSAFAPVENPQIAIAVMVEGDTPGEETGGGRYAVPVAQAILKTWWEKQQRAAGTPVATPAPAAIRTARE